jgi:hypothetical protein
MAIMSSRPQLHDSIDDRLIARAARASLDAVR